MPLLALAGFAFLVFGALLALPGALQPAFAAAFGLDMAQSGLLASALSLGIGAGVLGGGPLADRLSRRSVFAASVTLAALASAGAAAAGSALMLGVALAALGVGAGCYETVLNAAVPESSPARAAARTSAVHAAATLGAALGAQGLAAAARAASWQATLLAIAGALAVLAACGALADFPARVHDTADEGRAPTRLPVATLAPFALASAAYVGLETAFSALLPALSASFGLGAERGANGMTGFWLGLFAARLVFAQAALPARRRELVLGAAVSTALFVLGALAGPRWLEPWSAAIGFALGAVFPVLVVLSGDAAPARRATALSWVVAAGSLGGTLVPWLAGAAGEGLGGRYALGVLALASAAIGLGVALARAPGRREGGGPG
jgi:fucose permease